MIGAHVSCYVHDITEVLFCVLWFVRHLTPPLALSRDVQRGTGEGGNCRFIGIYLQFTWEEFTLSHGLYLQLPEDIICRIIVLVVLEDFDPAISTLALTCQKCSIMSLQPFQDETHFSWLDSKFNKCLSFCPPPIFQYVDTTIKPCFVWRALFFSLSLSCSLAGIGQDPHGLEQSVFFPPISYKLPDQTGPFPPISGQTYQRPLKWHYEMWCTSFLDHPERKGIWIRQTVSKLCVNPFWMA